MAEQAKAGATQPGDRTRPNHFCRTKRANQPRPAPHSRHTKRASEPRPATQSRPTNARPNQVGREKVIPQLRVQFCRRRPRTHREIPQTCIAHHRRVTHRRRTPSTLGYRQPMSSTRKSNRLSPLLVSRGSALISANIVTGELRFTEREGRAPSGTHKGSPPHIEDDDDDVEDGTDITPPASPGDDEPHNVLAAPVKHNKKDSATKRCGKVRTKEHGRSPDYRRL